MHVHSVACRGERGVRRRHVRRQRDNEPSRLHVVGECHLSPRRLPDGAGNRFLYPYGDRTVCRGGATRAPINGWARVASHGRATARTSRFLRTRTTSRPSFLRRRDVPPSPQGTPAPTPKVDEGRGTRPDAGAESTRGRHFNRHASWRTVPAAEHDEPVVPPSPANTGFQTVVVAVDVPPTTTGQGTMTLAQTVFTIALGSTQTVVTITIPVPVTTTAFGVQFAARNDILSRPWASAVQHCFRP